MRTQTVYNGSSHCAVCGKLITPLEAMYGNLCPSCRGKKIKALILNKMVDGSQPASGPPEADFIPR